jgi:acyl-CoA synthetase (NDP forming)
MSGGSGGGRTRRASGARDVPGLAEAGEAVAGGRSAAGGAAGAAAATTLPHGVAALLEARHVALVGASPNGRYARAALANLLALGFPRDAITLVHPSGGSLMGLPCVPLERALDHPPDAALLLTPARAAVSIVEDLSAAGTRGAVVLASGFAESGAEGADLQHALRRAAGPMALCGPNTLGLVSLPERLALFGGQLPALRPGPVGAVFQSGGMMNLFVQLCAERGLGVSRAVVTGNEAILATADYVDYLAADPGTGVIALYLESVTAGPRLRRALAAAAREGKAVVALVVGCSERAARSVRTHSGNLAAGRAWACVVEGCGGTVVGNVADLLNAVALHAAVARSGTRATTLAPGVQCATVSGGDCGLMSDIAQRVGLELPDLSGACRAEIGRLLDRTAFLGNPMDLGGLIRGRGEVFAACVDALCGQEHVGPVCFRLNLPEQPEPYTRRAFEAAAEIARRHGRLPIFLTRGAEHLSPAWYELFSGLGVPLLSEFESAFRAIRSLVAPASGGAVPPPPPEAEREGAGGPGPFGAVGPGVARRLALAELRPVLTRYGIPVAPTVEVRSARQAASAFRDLGPRAVLKADSRAMPHKTEAGAVELGIASARAAAAAWTRLSRLLAQHGDPEGRIVMQPMLLGCAEMLAGVVNRGGTGPLVMAGIGGVFVELYGDVVMRPAPFGPAVGRAMINDLRGRALLHGVRGLAPADVDGFARLLARLSELAWDARRELAELDINPVLLRRGEAGLWAVDAFALLEPPPEPPPSQRRPEESGPG